MNIVSAIARHHSLSYFESSRDYTTCLKVFGLDLACSLGSAWRADKLFFACHSCNPACCPPSQLLFLSSSGVMVENRVLDVTANGCIVWQRVNVFSKKA